MLAAVAAVDREPPVGSHGKCDGTVIGFRGQAKRHHGRDDPRPEQFALRCRQFALRCRTTCTRGIPGRPQSVSGTQQHLA